MFVLEEIDKQVLKNPRTIIIDNGGVIIFAKTKELGIIGTVALMKADGNSFELTKMGVLENIRGLKVGEVLLEAILMRAKAMNIKKLFLLTNSKCEAAIHLYEKLGFEHSKEIMDEFGHEYERCDVAMLYTKK